MPKYIESEPAGAGPAVTADASPAAGTGLSSTVHVDLTRLAPWLARIAVILVICHLGFLILRHGYDRDYVLGLSPMFDMWGEGSFPAFFAALLWIIAAAMLVLIAWADDGARRRWLLLAGVAFFLGLDENFALHEELILPVRALLQSTGVLFFPWFLPYGIALAVLGVLYIPFLRRLPPASAIRIIVAGAVFLSGAVGFEMIEGIYFEPDPWARTPWLDTLVTIEESLELAGILLFIHALAKHIQDNGLSAVRFRPVDAGRAS